MLCILCIQMHVQMMILLYTTSMSDSLSIYNFGNEIWKVTVL